MLIFISIFVLLAAPCNSLELMDSDQTPNPGDANPDTVYEPGNSGANWTPEEIDATRQRILRMITPIWPEKIFIGTAKALGKNAPLGETTENTLMRLAFHDCIPYLDGGVDDRLVLVICSFNFPNLQQSILLKS